MKTVNLTCVECPLGCNIQVVTDQNSIVEILGNTCPRGKTYATSEITCPVRVLTTTVKTNNGKILSVKTDAPVKKANMQALMKVINTVEATVPVKIGDVIIKNLEDGVNLVATDNLL